MYLYEAHQRWYSYPPPYNGTSYATPWLWYDGNPHGSYIYTNWQNLIVNRMNVASPVTITMWGNYNATTRSGTINARFRNDTPYPLAGNVLFVITEDSIQLSTPNGDLWHNHVARDYVPDYIGSAVEIAGGDSLTYSQPFTLLSNWNLNRCEIVTFFQNTRLAPDSTKEMYQGSMIKVRDILSGIEEERNDLPIGSHSVQVLPNPGVSETRFAFTLPTGNRYKINIFDVSGRTVKTLNGVAGGKRELVKCELNKAGVYFYHFESEVVNSTGKIVIK